MAVSVSWGSALSVLRIRALDYLGSVSLGLQIAQSRPYLHTLGPKVGIIYIHGAPGYLGPDPDFWNLPDVVARSSGWLDPTPQPQLQAKLPSAS